MYFNYRKLKLKAVLFQHPSSTATGNFVTVVHFFNFTMRVTVPASVIFALCWLEQTLELGEEFTSYNSPQQVSILSLSLKLHAAIGPRADEHEVTLSLYMCYTKSMASPETAVQSTIKCDFLYWWHTSTQDEVHAPLRIYTHMNRAQCLVCRSLFCLGWHMRFSQHKTVDSHPQDQEPWVIMH